MYIYRERERDLHMNNTATTTTTTTTTTTITTTNTNGKHNTPKTFSAAARVFPRVSAGMSPMVSSSKANMADAVASSARAPSRSM